MSGEKQHIRLDNVRKAREAWKLRLEGFDNEKISSKLSVPASIVDEIFKYTVSDHYTHDITKPSYYDEQLLIKKKISLGQKKLKKLGDSIDHKKKIFHIILQATAVMVFALIVI